MKTLFLTTDEEYLQDSMIYGLRKILGADLVDYPRKDAVYKDYPKAGSEMYGMGFTIWKLLDNIEIDRSDIEQKIRSNYFDLIIFGRIYAQKQLAKEYLKKNLLLHKTSCLFLDGEDHSKLFWNILPYGKYFKRERSWYNYCFTLPVSFSIPDEKVRQFDIPKEFQFAKHVQCDEAYKIPWVRENCQKKYAFSDEKSYYENIAKSWYAVTMEKAGWDCMRHYEIAANGTVMAFYRLKHKSIGSAPHGLIDMVNVVAFDTAEELMRKIDYIQKNNLYPALQQNTRKWILQNTCEAAADRLLAIVKNDPRSI